MKITTITGQSEVLNLEVQKSISHLVIKKSVDPFLAFSTEKLSARILDSETSKEIEICKFIYIDTLGEINACLPGALRLVLATSKTDTVIIQLNDEGIRLSGSRKLFLDFTGMVAGASYDVYGVESSTSDETPFVYEKKVVSNGLTDFTAGVLGYGLLAINLNIYDIKSVSLTYSNGAVVNMDEAEIEHRQYFDNDLVRAFEPAGGISGLTFSVLGNYCILNMVDVTSIRIVSQSGGIEYYLLKMAD